MKAKIFFLVSFFCLIFQVQAKETVQGSMELVLDVDGKEINWAQLRPKKKFVLYYVDPDCGHCKHEIDALDQRISKFRDTDVFIMSFAQIDMVKAFVESHPHLKSRPNVHILSDSKDKFSMSVGGITGWPQSFIMDKDLKVLKKFEGASVDKLIDELYPITYCEQFALDQVKKKIGETRSFDDFDDEDGSKDLVIPGFQKDQKHVFSITPQDEKWQSSFTYTLLEKYWVSRLSYDWHVLKQSSVKLDAQCKVIK